ncbi:MAG: hypothetical protein M1835_004831 [Candelina submexicana]|nr:MAG: hypothetical protein M1835_004831 [Candelina submexicana]
MYFLTVLLLFTTSVNAIRATKNSPCTNACGGTLTQQGELNCNDDAFNTTDNGRKMKSCLQCESTSTMTNSSSTTDSDQYWFMFNMKYSLQVCLFDSLSDAAHYTSCTPQCGNLRTVLQTTWSPAKDPSLPLYDYCAIDSGSFPWNADACATCLRTVSGSQVLANFLNTMKGACDNKPDPFQGKTVNLPRALFDTTDPGGSSPASSAASSSAPSASSTSTNSAQTTLAAVQTSGSTTSTTNTSAPAGAAQVANHVPTASSVGTNGLSNGAVAGIGVAAAIGGISIFAAALAFFWRRRRHQRERRLSSSSPLQTQYTNDKAGSLKEPGLSPQQSYSEQRHEADDGQPPAELQGTQFHGF